VTASGVEEQPNRGGSVEPTVDVAAGESDITVMFRPAASNG
jgi:hypothetical protein